MVEIVYKCHCMPDEVTVFVTDRIPDSDIHEWMELVVKNSLSYDHHTRSPHCQAQTMEYCKIPASDAGIGVKPTVN